MTSNELRQAFLEFFRDNDHEIVASSAALAWLGIGPEQARGNAGISADADGQPDGRIAEAAGMAAVAPKLVPVILNPARLAAGMGSLTELAIPCRSAMESMCTPEIASSRTSSTLVSRRPSSR